MHTLILQSLLKMLISLLLALLPIYNLLAQTTQPTEKPGTVRVKMFKSVNGKMVYSKDTVLSAEDHRKLLDARGGVKFDIATREKLNLKQLYPDSVRSVMMMRRLAGSDTATFRRLKDVQVYRMSPGMSKEEQLKFFEKLKNMPGDTFLKNALKSEKIMLMRGDTLRNIEVQRFELNDGAARAFSIMHAGHGPDSAHMVISINSPEGFMIRRGENMLGTNTITARYSTSDKIKIETDESGKTTVYEVDENGNKKEIDAYHFGRTGEKPTVVVFRKMLIEDISKEDKKALKEGGAKVEKSAKKELKIDNLSYYPNPNNGRFNLSFTLPDKGEAIVRVMNSVGKEVYQEKVAATTRQFEKKLDISRYGKGLFYLQVEQNGRTLTKRLLVQ